MPTPQEIATWPEVAKLSQTSREALWSLLIRWLVCKNPRKNHLAAMALIHIGEMRLPDLVREVSRGSEVKRLRILDVIARIGKPLGATAFFDLMFSLRNQSCPVRARIVQVLVSLQGPGPKPDEELPPPEPRPRRQAPAVLAHACSMATAADVLRHSEPLAAHDAWGNELQCRPPAGTPPSQALDMID